MVTPSGKTPVQGPRRLASWKKAAWWPELLDSLSDAPEDAQPAADFEAAQRLASQAALSADPALVAAAGDLQRELAAAHLDPASLARDAA
jgi:hypothetical protein